MITDNKATLFIASARRFLNHKIILGEKSHYYQCSFKKQPLDRTKQIFGPMLSPLVHVPVGHWAIYIKRHEELLMAILPVPGSSSYESSLKTAHDLVKQASEIIDALNLNDLV
jgi:hypothetical protein